MYCFHTMVKSSNHKSNHHDLRPPVIGPGLSFSTPSMTLSKPVAQLGPRSGLKTVPKSSLSTTHTHHQPPAYLAEGTEAGRTCFSGLSPRKKKHIQDEQKCRNYANSIWGHWNSLLAARDLFCFMKRRSLSLLSPRFIYKDPNYCVSYRAERKHIGFQILVFKCYEVFLI